MYSQADEWTFQPTASAERVVDTTGAGDAFAAGFLFGWCGARDVQRGLVYGCACGAAAVGQLGGSSPLDAATVDAAMGRDVATAYSYTEMGARLSESVLGKTLQ